MTHAVTIPALRGKQCLIPLAPRGYRSQRTGAHGSVTSWCEPDQRAELGRCLDDCRAIARRCPKSALIALILALRPGACIWPGARKAALATSAANLLIDVWMPHVDADAGVNPYAHRAPGYAANCYAPERK